MYSTDGLITPLFGTSVDWWIDFFILASCHESDGGAIDRMYPDSLRNCFCFRVFRFIFVSDFFSLLLSGFATASKLVHISWSVEFFLWWNFQYLIYEKVSSIINFQQHLRIFNSLCKGLRFRTKCFSNENIVQKNIKQVNTWSFFYCCRCTVSFKYCIA